MEVEPKEIPSKEDKNTPLEDEGRVEDKSRKKKSLNVFRLKLRKKKSNWEEKILISFTSS